MSRNATRPDSLHVVPSAAASRSGEPTCAMHPHSRVRRYRTFGPNGPGVYPQCLPGDGSPPHLLSWRAPDANPAALANPGRLTPSELEVLDDAAAGLTVGETAIKRSKSVETVKSQRRSILLKLGARNIAQAVAMTLRQRMQEHELAA